MALLDSKQLNPKLTGSFILSGSTQTFIGESEFTGSVNVNDNLNVSQYIVHKGDSNTYLNFTDDRLRFNIGGISYIDLNDATSAPHDITFNDGANNVDLTIKGSSNNPLFKTDASTNRIGTHGKGTPEVAFHIGGSELRVDGTISGSDYGGNVSGSSTSTGSFGELEVDTNTTIGGDLFVKEYIKHTGDVNTAIRFTDNKISFDAGGMTFFAVHDDDSAPFTATINGGGNKINFRAFDENQDLLLKTDSEAFSVELYHAGNKKLETTSTGIDVTGQITASGNVSSSATSTFSAGTFTGTFSGALSSSAQIAEDISGSFSKEHLGAKVANVVTSSAQLAADISGSFGNQRVGTTDSPTFAGGTVTGNFVVGGKLTAQEIHTEIESSSILFTSGSTKFGDTIDDIHSMTGSLVISGSVNASSFVGLLSQSAQIADDISGSFSKEHLAEKVANVVTSSAQIAADISGSLGDNADVIRSLDRTTISGSFTAVSASLASRITSEEGEAEGSVVSSSAQIAADISGSFSKEHLGTKVPNVVSSSAQIADDISGSFAEPSGNVSGSSTSTGSFGRVEAAGDISVGGSIRHGGDSDTRILFTDDDINIAAGGKNFVDFTEDTVSEATFNEEGVDIDFRVESENDNKAIFVDASQDSIQLGSAAATDVTISGDISGSSSSTGSFGRVEAAGVMFADSFVSSTGGATIDFNDDVSLAGSLTTTGKIELGREPVQGFNYLARQSEGEVSASSKAHTFTALAASKTSNHPYKNLGSGQGYVIDGVESPFLYLTEGHYKFDYSGASSHPVRFYFDAAKTTQYNPSSHVSVDGNVITLKIDKDSPQIIYYQCSSHGYMGWAIHTGQNSQGQDENGMRTLISGSAQIASDISGSFTSVSSSLAARLTSEESEAEGLVVSSSAQIATDISGSSTALSASLSTRLTTFDITQIDIDGADDIGAAITDADLIILDDGAGGTNRKATMSRLKSYMGDISGGSTLGNIQVGVTAAGELDTSTGNLTLDSAGGTVVIDDNLQVAGDTTLVDVTVTGTLTAQEIHTTFESASIISTSGSTKFGNSMDDVHNITGSVNTTGSISADSFSGTFDGALSSSAQIAGDISGSFANPSGNVSGSSISTGSFGKLIGDGSDITNLPSAAITSYGSTGDNRIITSVNSTNVQGEANLTFDGTSLTLTGQLTSSGDISGSSTSTGSFGIIEVGGGQFTSASLAAGGSVDIDSDAVSGSFNKGFEFTGTISGSSTSTGSFGQIVVGGGVFTSASLAAGGSGGDSSFTAAGISGSFNKGFEFSGEISGSSTSTGSFGLVVGDGSGLSNVAASITVKEEGTDLTTAVSSINFVGDGITATTSGNDVTVTQLLTRGAGDASVVDVSTASTTWAVTHSLDNRYPTVTIYDESNQVIIPESITADTANTATITFEQAVSGKASFTLGIPTSSLFISESAQLLSEIADSTVDGDLTITGKLTAQEIHTEIESASIIFTSGSTIFGDSIDDTHFFTGSLLISGSVDASTISGSFDKSDIKTSLPDNTVSSSAQLADDISGSLGSNASVIRTLTADAISGSFTAVSSSVASRLDSLSGDIIALSIALG
tara:strand:- start:6013 stop:10779 length:4767 start_codon:yes stop_codon:yes gene_type:complete